MSEEADVQLPALAVDATGKDLAEPTLTLLRDLELLAKPDDQTDKAVGPLSGTPYSLQVISAGALSFNKWWSSVVAVAGGGGAIWTGVQAYFAKQHASVEVSLVLGAAALAAAALLSIAIIVRSDVQARTQATVAQYVGRTDVARTFMRLTAGVQLGSRSSSPQAALWVTVQTEGSKPFLVIGTRHGEDHTYYLLARGDERPQWRKDDQITEWGVDPTA